MRNLGPLVMFSGFGTPDIDVGLLKDRHLLFVPTFLLAGALPLAATPQDAAGFREAVQPVLQQNCLGCHNEGFSSGGLNISPFTEPGSVDQDRVGWEQIVGKIRSGEMPPQGMPKPTDEQIAALVAHIEGEFDRLDAAQEPDPGRVVARRLNRVEYANTVRDLLGVYYRAEDEFPADDSGYGFDNIGDVLTVSPLLIEKYLSAAEKISAQAIGADPLPKPVLTEERARVRRLNIGATEVTDYIDYNAEYEIRAWIAGHLGEEGKPATLVLSVDGKPVRTVQISTAETESTRVARTTQRINEEVRVYLTAGEHTFRAELVGEQFEGPIPLPKPRVRGQRPPEEDPMIYPERFDIHGPFPAENASHPTRDKILTCDPAEGMDCIERILTPLATRAYRRPATQAEIATLLGVAKKAMDAGYAADQGVQFALQAILISPKFLFRVEQDPDSTVGEITEYELASRLSYFLWSSMPDDELFALAEAGKLRDEGVLNAQIERMLADPKSEALADNFVGQWLEIRSLDAVRPDRRTFPQWNDDLKRDMETETRLFFEDLLRNNRPVSEFLTADFTYLNDRLARHYGIEGVEGSEFRKVQLTTDQRGGILSHGSVLTVTSYPARTSPVLRGKYILEAILGTPPPPPPPDVPKLKEDEVGKNASLREQMEQHRSDAVCASCHVRMDPLGFGLENYNAIGQWRTEDGEFPVDSKGKLPNGQAFDTPAQLRGILSEDLQEFTRNLTEKMMTYALGRGTGIEDRPVVRGIVKEMKESDYRFQTLVQEIVHSLPFQARQGGASENTEVASR